jgi:hypothetical protein
MQFPDSVDRPSRTIAATAAKASRASIVIQDERIGGKYRAPTLRECASLQGFPISYQFWASGRDDKQRLVGNAVPPPLARALAVAIALENGIQPPAQIDRHLVELAPPILCNASKPKPYVFPILRHYRNSVKDTLPYCRVELDNRGIPSKYPVGEGSHLVGWRTVFVLGYARDYAAFDVDFETAQAIVETVSQATLDQKVERTVGGVFSQFVGQVPDATSLQAKWARRDSIQRDPDWILHKVSQIARRTVGAPGRRKVGTTGSEIAPLLRGKMIAHGDDIDKARWENKLVDPYSACALLSLCVATKLANEGREWLARNWESRYPPAPGLDVLEAREALASPRDEELFLPTIELR